jgi:hypothetical protein
MNTAALTRLGCCCALAGHGGARRAEAAQLLHAGRREPRPGGSVAGCRGRGLGRSCVQGAVTASVLELGGRGRAGVRGAVTGRWGAVLRGCGAVRCGARGGAACRCCVLCVGWCRAQGGWGGCAFAVRARRQAQARRSFKGRGQEAEARRKRVSERRGRCEGRRAQGAERRAQGAGRRVRRATGYTGAQSNGRAAGCSVQRAACSVQRAACSVQRG